METFYHANDVIHGYQIIQRVTEGRYGIIYFAKSDKYKKVILKQLKKSEEKNYSINYEQITMEKLNSNCFPKLLEYFIYDGYEFYVIEFIEGKVFEDITRRDKYNFSKQEIWHIADQLLDIIDILHKNGIVHRDIRLPNVIVKRNGDLVLIDFGLARFVSPKYSPGEDFWYLADFLIHLYYTNFKFIKLYKDEKPWYNELKISKQEKHILRKLMGLNKQYTNVEQVKKDIEKLRKTEVTMHV